MSGFYLPVVVAALWMLGTLSSFALMAIGARELSADLSTFQILFFRSLVGFAVMVALLLWRGGLGGQTQHLGVHVLRNVAHLFGQYGWFYGIAFIPLAEVFALEFTVPVWTAIIAALLLRERINAGRIIAIVFGLVGALLILRPGMEIVHPAAMAVLGGAMAYGLSHTLTKKLSATDTPFAIVFYMTLIQLPVSLFPALTQWTMPVGTQWFWLSVVGITALIAHYCMAKALVLADATVVIPMDFLRLPLIAVVGYMLYGELVEWPVLVGVMVMLFGNWLNVYGAARSARGTTFNRPDADTGSA